MYKEGKWAKRILALQDTEGKWGWFHSLSGSTDASLTTEMALRRLQRLGFTMEDECIQRAVGYMSACLKGEKQIPDRREKLHNWDLFTSLMLSAWIREFTPNCEEANEVAHNWAKVITHAFASGMYDHARYVEAYAKVFGKKPMGSRLVDFCQFYVISLLKDQLAMETQHALVAHVLYHPNGIYYVYDRPLCVLPQRLNDRLASRYLMAVELLARYPSSRGQLDFVRQYLLEQRLPDGRWDMGAGAKDQICFPLSDSWRRREDRISDCTAQIEALLYLLEQKTGPQACY